MTEPMRDTLARIDALRGQEAQRSTWILSRGRLAEYDLDALVAEHNAYPQVRETLERARGIIGSHRGRVFVRDGEPHCVGCDVRVDKAFRHREQCVYRAAELWLADYEGARDA